ncbi:hypothetical protein EG68_06556 [Paragonimus skrjabini miyazakii]|uniref:Uncharacterized protein n=1 Tax=Paragonimus skrjabini miyazakii TaxID=59628 RepID=A0A8S9YPC7_9TREM|nr:hypothetical protein EG68_06556 [Paragonimus skrjabini miyazakii]
MRTHITISCLLFILVGTQQIGGQQEANMSTTAQTTASTTSQGQPTTTMSAAEQRLREVLKNRTSLSDEDITTFITELRKVPGPVKTFFIDELAKRFNLPSDVVQTLRGLAGGAETCRVGSLIISAVVMYHLLAT